MKRILWWVVGIIPALAAIATTRWLTIRTIRSPHHPRPPIGQSVARCQAVATLERGASDTSLGTKTRMNPLPSAWPVEVVLS